MKRKKAAGKGIDVELAAVDKVFLTFRRKNMIFVPNENNDPRINLAIEQYLLQEMPLDEPIFALYINEPSIIIGRNQKYA